MTFFCPYKGSEFPDADASLEHVVPESLGGSKNFSINVEAQANSQLGTEVDGRILDLFAHHRVTYDLRGHSGKAAKVVMRYTVDALHGHQGKLQWGLEQTAAASLETKVEKTQLADGTISFIVSGEPHKARARAAEIVAAHEARGRKVILNEGAVQTIEQPSVNGEFKFDLVAAARFDLKLTIGAMHWITDGQWSREGGADKLRKALWATTQEDIDAVGIECGLRKPTDFMITLAEHEHGFLCAPTGSLGHALGVFLFGGAGRCTIVTDRESATCLTFDPVLVILDVKTGAVQKLVGVDLVRQRRMTI